MSVIPALQGLEDQKLKVTLSYIIRPAQNTWGFIVKTTITTFQPHILWTIETLILESRVGNITFLNLVCASPVLIYFPLFSFKEIMWANQKTDIHSFYRQKSDREYIEWPVHRSGSRSLAGCRFCTLSGHCCGSSQHRHGPSFQTSSAHRYVAHE